MKATRRHGAVLFAAFAFAYFFSALLRAVTATLAPVFSRELALGAGDLGLLAGAFVGAFNGFWIARVGLPSLAVTLAGLIGFRGVARILLEDHSIGDFPEWFDRLGQQPLIGPFPFSMIVFVVLFIITLIVLQYSSFGRHTYVIGNNKDVARYSGVKVQRVKMIIFTASGLIAALAGILLAARLGAVRGDLALGFELDIITMVVLGGVSIFGGSGSLIGVGLSILLILNLRNGMALSNISGHIQTGVIGMLLIFSVLAPNIAQFVQEQWKQRKLAQGVPEDISG